VVGQVGHGRRAPETATKTAPATIISKLTQPQGYQCGVYAAPGF
jgi:hypothetical protein